MKNTGQKGSNNGSGHWYEINGPLKQKQPGGRWIRLWMFSEKAHSEPGPTALSVKSVIIHSKAELLQKCSTLPRINNCEIYLLIYCCCLWYSFGSPPPSMCSLVILGDSCLEDYWEVCHLLASKLNVLSTLCGLSVLRIIPHRFPRYLFFPP